MPIVRDMSFEIDINEVDSCELVQVAQMTRSTLRVCVKLEFNNEDMSSESAYSSIDERMCDFSYNDGKQCIVGHQLQGISNIPTTQVHAMFSDPDEDLFKYPDLLEGKLSDVVDYYSQKLEEGNDYTVIDEFQDKVEPLGFTFDYGLDGVPYDLRKVVWPRST
jgi:hypothetical protein